VTRLKSLLLKIMSMYTMKIVGMIIPDKLEFKYKQSFLFVNHTKKESFSLYFSISLILALVVG
jgi:hypothetical protein